MGMLQYFDSIKACVVKRIRGLFNASAIFVEEKKWHFLTYSLGEKKLITFPNDINPKINVLL